ncbi:G-protein coupled receptor moody-like [Patiria miniata]|uniref:G-protein coupled receptors family 1 profile domain-containing protein n=1 Tax=Patiria miniata TaxID=46514 RepID=A0A914B5E2_PATMI|nr:G-protein coupled receptor moody-like [Patiria miniata]
MSNVPSLEGGSAVSVFDSFAEKQLLAALFGLMFFIGVLGNSSVLLAVVLSRKPRSATNVFVVNLAVADLITCLSLPIMVLALLSDSREKLLVPDNLCALQGFVLIVCIGCSLNNIATIAFYRALITRRRRPIWLFNRRGLATIVATTWLIPLVVGLLPIISEFGSYEYDDKLSTCSYKGSATFSRIMSAAYYPVQLIVTFTSYALVFYTVRQHVRRVNDAPGQPIALVGGAMRLPLRPFAPMRPHQLAIQVTTSSSQEQVLATNQLQSNHPPSIARQPAPARRQLRRKIDVNLTLFLVVIFYIICVSPFLVLVLLLEDNSQKIVPFLGALIVSNSCINPVIYTARHPDFKAVIRCILLCKLSKIPMQSAFLRGLLSFRGR